MANLEVLALDTAVPQIRAPGAGDGYSVPRDITLSNNLIFGGTAQRITGDFSNATLSNRLAFQTSTTNGNTIVGAFPNGTGTNARLQLFSASDPANASTASMEANATSSLVIINADKTGTGTYLPMTFYTGGSERMRLDTSGRELIGLTDAATVGGVNNSALQIFGGGAARINVMRGDANANSPAVFLSKSRSTSSGTFSALQSGDGCGAVSFYGDDGSSLVTNVARIEAFVDGAVSGSTVPGRLVFSTNQGSSTASATERMRIDSSGNVGIGGTASALAKVEVTGTLPSSSNSSVGFRNSGTVPSTSTSSAHGFQTGFNTEAASFTLTALRHFSAYQATIGAGSTVTNQYGFLATNTLTGATNNYGFYSDIASGSNRWNFYAAGTAANYFAGSTGVGLAPDTNYAFTAYKSTYGVLVKTDTAANECTSQWNTATSGDNKFEVFYTDGGVARGSIDYNRAGGLVAYNTTSDYRAKDVYGAWDDAGATIDALKVYRGKMHGATQERPMMIAHEAQAVVPYAVGGEKDAVNKDGTPKYQTMDHQILVPLLIAELQAVRARLAALEAK